MNNSNASRETLGAFPSCSQGLSIYAPLSTLFRALRCYRETTFLCRIFDSRWRCLGPFYQVYPFTGRQGRQDSEGESEVLVRRNPMWIGEWVAQGGYLLPFVTRTVIDI